MGTKSQCGRIFSTLSIISGCHRRIASYRLINYVSTRKTYASVDTRSKKISQIYKLARQGVVWLGLSKSVAEQLRTIANAYRHTHTAQPSRATLKEIYSYTIWRRAWIWQELYFIPTFTLQYGYQTLPASGFVHLSQVIFPE
jgi:hypothetical protein